MKSMKTRLGLVALGIVAVGSFSLMIASNEINLKADLSNAVQNMEKVFFLKNILSNVESGVILTNSGNFVKIDTRGGDGVDKNIIIKGDGTYANSVNDFNSKGSHILGGEGNQINGSYDTIIGGLQNKISSGDYSTIGGGNHNIITGNYNVIAGGSENKIISGNYSTIPGGKNNKIEGSYSVALGVNNVVSGDYSVALGSGSKVIADRSFLWTDGNQEGELRANDVFAIVSKSGMVVNTVMPHDFAKLTVSGSLVINKGNNFGCSEDTKGTIVARGGGQVCLYSCDGSERNSLYKGVCPISDMVVSNCGVVNKICNADGSFYSGSCINGKVIEGTGSYFVDKDDNVHRTCQSEDGNLTECSGAVNNINGSCPSGEYECDLSLIDDDPSKLNNIWESGAEGPLGGRFQKNFSDDIVTAEIFESDAEIIGSSCKGKCKDGFKVTLGLNGYYCTEKGCPVKLINSYVFPEANHNEVKQSTNVKLTKPWNDGEKKCRGEALCNVSDYIFSGENCTYICGKDPKIYSGYTYTATFQSGTYVTGTRTMNSGGIDYTCSIRLECLYDSIINLSGNEVCVPDGCEATTYTTGGHTYDIPSASVGSYRAYYTGPECVYNLPYECKSNSERWFGSETESCPRCSGVLPNGAIPNNDKDPEVTTGWYYDPINTGNACTFRCGPSEYYDDTYGCMSVAGNCSATDLGVCQTLGDSVGYECIDGLCVWQCYKDGVDITYGYFAHNWGVKGGEEIWCGLCENGNEPDWSYPYNGNCNNLTCHHCARNGFPYCFPIDFSSNCSE